MLNLMQAGVTQERVERVDVSVDEESNLHLSVLSPPGRVKQKELSRRRFLAMTEGQLIPGKRAKTISYGRVFEPNPYGTGQNGPKLSLTFEELNNSERKFFSCFRPYQNYSIRELGRLAFPLLSEEQQYSYSRNQLRRLVRGQLVKKTAVGIYSLTQAGESIHAGL